MTEEPEIFGEAAPFALVHADDLREFTRFLKQAGVATLMASAGPSLYKVRFVAVTAAEARGLMRRLIREGRSAAERQQLQ